jgi:hypothetical protein
MYALNMLWATCNSKGQPWTPRKRCQMFPGHRPSCPRVKTKSKVSLESDESVESVEFGVQCPRSEAWSSLNHWCSNSKLHEINEIIWNISCWLRRCKQANNCSRNLARRTRRTHWSCETGIWISRQKWLTVDTYWHMSKSCSRYFCATPAHNWMSRAGPRTKGNQWENWRYWNSNWHVKSVSFGISSCTYIILHPSEIDVAM